MKIVPFDHDRRGPGGGASHAGFVLSTWLASSGMTRGTLLAILANGGRCVVAETDEPDEVTGELVYFGWGAAIENRLVWCFVKQKHTPLKLDPAIVEALGLSPPDIGILFSGEQLGHMARRYGWTLHPDPRIERESA
jgi:hypothetical protein